ncbi:MAG: methyl-accepting chemotaxis protein [Fretibacterium sp.]|nr:methyl-accepting chemotaxis protein [Fretibacterium sp.]
MKFKLRLQAKVLLFLLGALFLIQGGIVANLSLQVRSNAVENSKAITKEAARRSTLDLEKLLASVSSSVHTAAQLMEMIDPTTPDARNVVMGMVKHLFEITPAAVSAWVVFEPNAFDGKDIEFAGKDGYLEKGRFEFTFLRSGGAITRTFDNTEESFAEDWYVASLHSGQTLLCEPSYYSYTEDEKDALYVVDYSVPIKVNGKTVGVVGFDIDLSSIQKQVASLTTTSKSFAVLFSNSGLQIYHPNPKRIGQNLRDSAQGQLKTLEETLTAIAAGRELATDEYSIQLDQMCWKFFLPVQVEDVSTPWSLNFVVPYSDITADADALTLRVILTSLLGILLLGILIFSVTRSIVRPIRRVSASLSEMADLNFTQTDSTSLKIRRDEIGDMQAALSSMRERIASFVRSIRESSSHIFASSENLAALSQETTASMEEMQSSVEQIETLSKAEAETLNRTSGEVEHLSSGSNASASAAHEGAQDARAMAEASSEATAQIREAVKKMEDVGRRSANTLSTLDEVGVSVDSISSFVETIVRIAGQTNLLALNAAIEAARAGEQGRGFAVVADSVRNLAEESSHAADQVGSLISSLQEKAAASIASMREVDGIVDDVVETSGVAVANLGKVMELISRVSGSVQNLAGLAQEQAAQAKEVSDDVLSAASGITETFGHLTGIRRAAQDTSTASENVAQEAQDLASKAGELQDILAHFNIGSTPSLPERRTRS